MVNFLLYLFETGLCISLLYLVYFFFLRKETYFNFNRLYLLAAMVLALIIPLIHVTIVVPKTVLIEESFSKIGEFRNYYNEHIFFTEPEVTDNRYKKYEAAIFENDFDYDEQSSIQYSQNNNEIKKVLDTSQAKKQKIVSIIQVVFIIYLSGVIIFSIRLLLLILKLVSVIKRNPRSKNGEYELIQMKEDTPPFSFFRYIFVTKDALMLNEFEQILAHEKIHVKQKHSLDLLIAHVITVFQWFNPLVWRLQLAIKTTHEYIADNKVVGQGFELFDYQSLLLKQLISIRSVELVNNFNLISIKKRIAMMTKNKSGIPAKLKALLIIPSALAVFFLFAQLTVKSPVLSFTNFNTTKVSNLDGIWLNHDNSTFGKLLHFDGEKLSVLEKYNEVKVIDLNIKIKDDKLVLTGYGPTEQSLRYSYSGSLLKIWWNSSEYSTYEKTSFKNSFEAFAPQNHNKMQLPKMNQAKIFEQQKYVYKIYVHPEKYFVDDQECRLSNLKKTIENRIAQFNVLDRPYVTAHFIVDKNTKMKSLFEVYQVLRELRLYKVSYGSYPDDNHSLLQYHASGIPQMMPPLAKDGAEAMDYEEIGEDLIILSPDEDYKKQAGKFEKFLRSHSNYIASYEWNNNTKYGDYVNVINMAYEVIYKLRDEVAQNKYGMDYSQLTKDKQKEIRKEHYPMRISQNNTDEDEN